ncbi:MAG: hypothetical protein KTR30_23220 [Saprospiraceae bacterium]|nr:hypothetical protein [Saprospiraceae bacterium]
MKAIPIYSIVIPNYKFKQFQQLSGAMHYTEFGTAIPIEYWAHKPDFSTVSQYIIQQLRTLYFGQKIGLRLLSSMEHPDKSVEDLIAIIQQIGHDRYDLKRKGDGYQNIEQKQIDLFLLEIAIGQEKGSDGEEQIRHALQSFYCHPFSIGKKPSKIDLGIVYQLDHLEAVSHTYEGRSEAKKDGFIFKSPERKSGAILAILKLLPLVTSQGSK